MFKISAQTDLAFWREVGFKNFEHDIFGQKVTQKWRKLTKFAKNDLIGPFCCHNGLNGGFSNGPDYDPGGISAKIWIKTQKMDNL